MEQAFVSHSYVVLTAAGLGYGLVHGLLQLGSLLSFETSVPESGWYNMEVCELMPYTYAQGLSGAGGWRTGRGYCLV